MFSEHSMFYILSVGAVWVLCGPAQSVPPFDRLLWCADHVHPVLQLRAPGVHERPEHQYSQYGRRLWQKKIDRKIMLEGRSPVEK